MKYGKIMQFAYTSIGDPIRMMLTIVLIYYAHQDHDSISTTVLLALMAITFEAQIILNRMQQETLKRVGKTLDNILNYISSETSLDLECVLKSVIKPKPDDSGG